MATGFTNMSPDDADAPRSRRVERRDAASASEQKTDGAERQGGQGEGQDALEQTVAQVQRARHPRWRVLRRGRAWVGPYTVGVVVLLALAVAAHNTSVLPVDLPFTRELQETRSPLLYGLMYAVSFLGTLLPVIVITLLALVALWALRLSLEAVFLAIGLTADALGAVIKLVVERQRPSPSLVQVSQHLHTYSFPSGHVLHYTMFYGFLAFVIFMNFRASWRRNALVGLCLALVVLVGPSRIYLGEHWLTDVVGGYILGGLCLTPLILGYLWAKERYELGGFPPRLRRLAGLPPTRV